MLRPSRVWLTVCLTVLMGCGGGAATLKLDPRHPAGPDAPEAGPVIRSVVLAQDEFDGAGTSTGVLTRPSGWTLPTHYPPPASQPHHQSMVQDSVGMMTGGSFPDSTAEIPAPGFVCPMHRDVVDTTASECPKCGMNLVPKVEDR